MASRDYTCYQPKQQFKFELILAENSSSPFKHLNVSSSSTANFHPFREEIVSLIKNPPEHVFLGIIHKDRLKTCTLVDSIVQLNKLANTLANQIVFAVDTEQHNQRSYLGFTALMQISTPEEDYLVDTIALHDEMAILRPVFSDPKICKVFHGAQNDVTWLQRDFHIYLVNLFDTYMACLVLEKPQKSLKGLLQSICNVETDKSIRSGDWTQRPLPERMFEYARKDTQYLLWIADVLAAELKEAKNYDTAVTRSNEMCLSLYTKGQEDFKLANRQQPDCRELAWKLCSWRDLMVSFHVLGSTMKAENLCYLIYEAMLEFAQKVTTMHETDMASDIFRCHQDDYFNQIINDKSVSLDTILPQILQKCLGINGTCRINLLNRSLLENFSIKPFSALVKSGKLTKASPKPIRNPDVAVYERDGTLKFWCNHGKGQWYVRTGLAEESQVHGEYALQLKNETLGGPEKIEKKKDLCNSCGKEATELNRHRIIPTSYRKYFPEKLNKDQFRYMVWMCRNCQRLALAAGERYNKAIRSKYEVSSDLKTVDTKEHVNIRRAAAVLLKKITIPEWRREEYIEVLEKHYGRRNLSDKDLEGALAIGGEKDEKSVEKQIIDKLLKESGEDGVIKFCEDWRNQFVNDLGPRYLPSNWSM